MPRGPTICICTCAAAGRGTHGNDSGTHGNLPDIMLQRIAAAPRPGTAQMAITMANGNLPQRICICDAPGRGTHVAH
eukprot:3548687-Karenia_brevis.AAC.1